jgi:hypothetical protein
LRWSADSRNLAFAWNAAAIRVLDLTAPTGNLLAASSELAAIGTSWAAPGSPVRCQATRGFALNAEGNEIVCAVSQAPAASAGLPHPKGGGACLNTQSITLGFALVTEQEKARLLAPVAEGCTLFRPIDGGYIGWASADGSTVIGSLVWDDGHARFGIFHDGRFTPLPKLPVSWPVPAGELMGTDAW